MNKNFILCFFFIVCLCRISNAQFIENFNDGDFTENPAWTGNVNDFLVNSAFQLQSNDLVANSNYFLTTPNSLAINAHWEMYIRIAFNPSSANFIDVYLTASAADLSLNTTTGYFLRIGNTDDEISLYRKDTGGTINKIIDGVNGILNKSNNVMKIEVIRDASGQWILNRDLSGTGNAYVTEGAITDTTYTSASFFGFLINQSTSGFFQKHFFDDIQIKNYEPDVIPPSIHSIKVLSSNSVDVLFSEPVETISSQLISNYSVNNNLGMPASALKDISDPALVHLIFSNSFSNAVTYALTANDIKDLSGNSLINISANFSFYNPRQYDVVIDEIMADPAPQVGLPNSEWIELRNVSPFDINLKNWKLNDLSGTSSEMPDFILQPDSLVIICSASSFSQLSAFGNTISVGSFPSLDNNGDLLSLYSATGATIHAVHYYNDWYRNELKKNGGWTLEMIDTKNPCNGASNWKASEATNGGTPGRINSIDGIIADESTPDLLHAFALNNTAISLVFDEPLDSLRSADINNYSIDKGIGILSASPVAPLFDKVKIVLNTPIAEGTIYSIKVNGVTDCIGNNIGSKNMARFGISQDAGDMDIVINEILFNPKTPGVDYVELYNRSNKIIDLNHFYIANRNSSNTISNIQQVTDESILLFPKDFMVLTSDSAAVKNQYITTNPDAFIVIKSMPSFPDDKGDVVILNNQGNIVDEVVYSDNWHFPLIANSEGVSLERIDYDGSSVQNNFHSAATSVGYGTPGYKNSQYSKNQEVQGIIKVTPDIFSPDNDGTDDFATISYSFPDPGYVANITIFDASGRPVRLLQRNSLSGTTGYYRWDGLDDKNRRLPQGIYIIYTEIFNTSGKKKQFKNTIVLARRY